MRTCHNLSTLVVAIGVLAMPAVTGAQGGELDPPGPPADPASNAYTLEDIYQRLTAGVAGIQSAFTEPAAGPGSTMHTLNEIMAAAPAADNFNGAAPDQVVAGATFWGLRTDGAWGPQTGSMPYQSIDNTSVSQSEGYYNAFNLATEDGDLVSGNIRAGVTIFGVPGNGNVVNTALDTYTGAAPFEICVGNRAWVSGVLVDGRNTCGDCLGVSTCGFCYHCTSDEWFDRSTQGCRPKQPSGTVCSSSCQCSSGSCQYSHPLNRCG